MVCWLAVGCRCIVIYGLLVISGMSMYRNTWFAGWKWDVNVVYFTVLMTFNFLELSVNSSSFQTVLLSK